MIIKPLFRLFCLFVFVGLDLSASTPDSLFRHFKKAANFDYNYPREKVYLHLDNNAYLEGETIWFKAYVVRASTLRPTELSRVLYVELLNDKGSIVQRKLLCIDSIGQAHGEFELKLPVRAGYYEVRAYTREMTNWGEEACFSRVVPVFSVSHKNNELNLPWPGHIKKTSVSSPRIFNYDERSDIRKLDFFTEGGHRVQGVAQRIAFRLTDGRGVSINEEIKIYSADSILTQTVAPFHEGMGLFELPDNFESGYAIVGNQRFDIPDIVSDARYALFAEKNAEGLTVICSGSASVKKPELLGLAVFCREGAVYFDTLSVGRERVELLLPFAALRGGVNRLELFDASGYSLCRRLVWHDAPERSLQFDVRQNNKKYEPFSPIALSMSLKDNEGSPVQTTFSLSVRDDGGELVDVSNTGIAIDMLLSSEVRGYIHNPEFYFEKDDEEMRKRALDLLLMVQGWQANSFETLCGNDPFEVKQPIEEKLTLTGQTFHDNDRRQPYAGLSLRINMYSNGGGMSLSGETQTDANGRFAFTSNVDFTGDWIAQISTRDSLDKRRWSRIALDRWFGPPVRSFDWRELSIKSPTSLYDGIEANINIFEWQDTLPRVLSSVLGEAVVVHHGKYRGFTGNRYTRHGGEKAGMRNADVFYNLEQAVEQYKDEGYGVPTVYRFLEKFDNNFSLLPNDDGGHQLQYRNQSPTITLNNERRILLPLETMMADEFKSVAVMQRGARSVRLSGHDVDMPALEAEGIPPSLNESTIETTSINDPDYTVAFYEIPDNFRFKTKRGVEKRRIQGYSYPATFYSPSYTGIDLPTDTDVRRTLYWNPCVTTDADGHASVVFFSNSRSEQQLRLSVRGVTSRGRFVDYER